MSAWADGFGQGLVLGVIAGVLGWAAVVEHRHWWDARHSKSCAVADHYRKTAP